MIPLPVDLADNLAGARGDHGVRPRGDHGVRPRGDHGVRPSFKSTRGEESGTGPILLNWPAQPTFERSSPGRGILISGAVRGLRRVKLCFWFLETIATLPGGWDLAHGGLAAIPLN